MLLHPEIGVYQITRLIEELLFANDCVIVPGFGGFVGKAVPANLNREQNIFLPPSKRIAFNGQLTHNDGLLTAALAKTYDLKFEEADARIQMFSRELQNTLLREKQFIFGRIGSFIQRDSLGCLFEPTEDVNFLPEAYGLPVLKLTPLLSKTVSLKTEENIIPLPQKDLTAKKNTAIRYLAAAISIPAAMLVLMWPFLQPVVNENSKNSSGFFATPAESKYTTHKDFQFPAIPDFRAKKNEAQAAEDHSTKMEATAETNIHPLTTEIKVTSAAPTATGYKTDGNAELIVGCFRLEENADKLVSELQSLGFDARISGQSPGGLFRVSLGPEAPRAELKKMHADAIAKGYSVWWLSK